MLKLSLFVLLSLPVFAGNLEILVDGISRPQYFARGTTYIEALNGREYEIRLTNPYGVRVAVALSVDGLNTIDARHTDARSARKWVLDPYESITLRGWQTSESQARRFFFTNEQNSYGQWLGRTENLGVISAAFFHERFPRPQPLAAAPQQQSRDRKGAEAVEPDYAATGIGRGVGHPVTQIHMDLEPTPATVVTMRYEYRPALISLGVIPQPIPYSDTLSRRQRARGFRDTGFCPEPPK